MKAKTTNLGLNSRVSLCPHLLDQPEYIKIFWNFLYNVKRELKEMLKSI